MAKIGQSTSVKLTKAHITNKEREIRTAVEDSIRGDELPPTPPKDLNTDQKKIFKFLYKELSPAKILSRLDLPTLKNACIVIDRLAKIDNKIETLMNLDGFVDLKILAKYHQMRNDYFGQFVTITRELCLSPTARAKMGTLAVREAQEAEDLLLKALGNAEK